MDGFTVNVNEGITLNLKDIHSVNPNITGQGDINITLSGTDKENQWSAGILALKHSSITGNNVCINATELIGSSRPYGIDNYGGGVMINANNVEIRSAGKGIFMRDDASASADVTIIGKKFAPFIIYLPSYFIRKINIFIIAG